MVSKCGYSQQPHASSHPPHALHFALRAKAASIPLQCNGTHCLVWHVPAFCCMQQCLQPPLSPKNKLTFTRQIISYGEVTTGQPNTALDGASGAAASGLPLMAQPTQLIGAFGPMPLARADNCTWLYPLHLIHLNVTPAGCTMHVHRK